MHILKKAKPTRVSTDISSDLNPVAILASVVLWLLLLLTVAYAMRLWQAAQVGNTVIGGDFAAFYTGGTLYLSGGNPYDRVGFSQALHSLRPTLPPNHELLGGD